MSRVFEIGGERSADVSDSAIVDRKFCAVGYDTEALATAAVYDYLDGLSLTTIGGMVLDRMSPTELKDIPGKWTVGVHWAPFRQKEPTPAGATEFSDPEFNFEFALSPEKIYLPIGSQTIYARTGADPPPAIRLIGDQGDGKAPEGVDVQFPTITQSETRYIKQSALTESDRNTLLRLLGKVNTTAFRGWDIGEVLFTGVSGRARGRDDWELNFRYSIRENSTVTVPDFDDIDKLGWEYIWPRYYLERDATNTLKRSQRIDYLVVAQVYPTAAFTPLE